MEVQILNIYNVMCTL